MHRVIRRLATHSWIPILLVLMASAHVDAAISEFNPIQRVELGQPAGNNQAADRLPAPQGIGNGVQIKDGYAGSDVGYYSYGLDSTYQLRFPVTGIDTRITRVEVLLALAHPHLNDLEITLLAANGQSVPLITRISSPSAPVYTFTQGLTTFYYGGIGFDFVPLNGVPMGNWNPITLVSEVDEDDAAFGDVESIADPTILDTTIGAASYLNTVRPGTYFSQGDLRAFNGLMGDGQANGEWRIRVVDIQRNNFTTDQNGTPQYTGWIQPVLYAQIIIHQEGGQKIWIGEGTTNNWSDGANWSPTGAPTTTQPVSVVFPGATINTGARYAPVNDIANVRLADLTVVNGTSAYDIDLQTLTFYRRCILKNSAGDNSLTVASGASLFAGRIKMESVLDTLTITGPITGPAGIKKIGDGTVVLDGGASTFTGSSYVDKGILRMLKPTALGSAAGNTTVRGTGLIEVGGLGAITEPLVMAGNGPAGGGPLHITGNQSWDGAISLDVATTGVTVDAAMNLTVSEFDQTPLATLINFRLSGGGTLTLAGAANEALFPPYTALSISGATLATNVAQTNLGNIVLSSGVISGTGALSPRDLNGFVSATDEIASSGTSSIANPINLAAVSRSIGVSSGTLTVTGVISNGSLVKNGSGTLALDGTNTGLPVSVANGVLAGSGTIGALSVTRGGALNPTDTFDVTQATFAAQSAFIVDAANDRLISAGTVALSGDDTFGIGGAVLQVYQNGPADGAVIITGANTGSFEGLPRGNDATLASIDYVAGTSVALGSGGADVGKFVWFDPTSYRVKESAGTVLVTATWTPVTGAAVLRHYGGGAVRDYNLEIGDADLGVAAGSVVTYSVSVVQNYVDTGDVTTTLALVPLQGARLSASPTPPGAAVATITILDDDTTDQKSCGFGTGLTVFLLFGFGLLLNARLRRR